MICPGCQTDSAVAEKNYGALYTCPSCQAVYFINFDGQPEYGEMTEQAPTDVTAETSDAAPSAPHFENIEPGDSDQLQRDDFSVPAESVENINNLTNDAVTSEDFGSVNPFANLSEQTSLESEASSDFNQAAQSIADFGNQDVQIAGLNYNLKISGLDTQELRELFKEAIDDSRFGWDASDLMRTVRNGEVEIIKLNPVQAYILAKRLQFVDVERRWIQNAMD